MYLSKDQNWQDETTIYWFLVSGDVYGVRDHNGVRDLVDEDGYVAELENHNNAKIFDSISPLITEEMERAQ